MRFCGGSCKWAGPDRTDPQGSGFRPTASVCSDRKVLVLVQLILMQLVQPVLVLVPSLTFWIFVFMVEGMVVGATNWKVGAALLGYWTGKLTTRWTRWPPKWADTTQLRFRASIWGQTHNRVRQPAEPGRRNRAGGRSLTSTLTFRICRLTRENSCCRVWARPEPAAGSGRLAA